MKLGTKSVLFGAHCFLIHPWFVAEAWRRLYGFPTDWRLWLAFFVHDLGYVGCSAMDDEEGERHVEWGAKQMQFAVLCFPSTPWKFGSSDHKESAALIHEEAQKWHDFSLYHSRFYAKRDRKPFSLLCVADKLALCLEPWWLYLPRVWATGELWEYLARAGGMPGSKYGGEPETGKYSAMNLVANDPTISMYRRVRYWHARMVDYLSAWVEAHKSGDEDTWTPAPQSPLEVTP